MKSETHGIESHVTRKQNIAKVRQSDGRQEGHLYNCLRVRGFVRHCEGAVVEN